MQSISPERWKRSLSFSDYMLIPLMASRQFGPNALARAMGVVLLMDSIGQTCFPFLLGLLYSRYGDYQLGLVIVVALAAAGATVIVFLRGVRRVPDASV